MLAKKAYSLALEHYTIQGGRTMTTATHSTADSTTDRTDRAHSAHNRTQSLISTVAALFTDKGRGESPLSRLNVGDIQSALIAFICDGDKAHTARSKILRRVFSAERLTRLCGE